MKKIDCNENIAIFPYNIEFNPILLGLINLGIINNDVKLISPSGWGICGLDAGEAFGQTKIGIKIHENFYKEIENCNSLIIAPYKKILKDKEADAKLENEITQYILYANDKNIKVNDLRNTRGINAEELKSLVYFGEEINIEVPIVYISGIAENINKLNVLIELGEILKAKGYRVSQIGSRQYCEILDIHSFPYFMFEKISETTKIDYFRQYINYINKTEKPDIIIIAIPGASIKFNEKIPLFYGITNFLASLAFTPDYSIVSVPLGIWNISDLYKHRFGYEISCCMVSNTKIYYDPLEHENELLYEIHNYEKTDELIKNYSNDSKDIHFNTFSKEDFKTMTNSLINVLGKSEYFSI